MSLLTKNKSSQSRQPSKGIANKVQSSDAKTMDERAKRFSDYLQKHGCPVRMHYRKEKEIQWIG
jgi:hypothetical protein